MRFDFDAIPDQAGRLAIVTGANTGLGFEATRYFAQKGMHVVMACRSEECARKAKSDIEAEIPSAKLSILALDLSDLASVQTFASSFRKKHKTLDALPLFWSINAARTAGYDCAENRPCCRKCTVKAARSENNRAV